MGQSKTRMIAEAGVAIAIAQVLSFITLFHMPQGGSIKAASLVPLMIFAYRWGGTRGIWAASYMAYFTSCLDLNHRFIISVSS